MAQDSSPTTCSPSSRPTPRRSTRRSTPTATAPCGLVANTDGTGDIDAAVKFYDLMSSLAYLPSSPTLFNSGTSHSQMSSCYLLDSPEDSLEGIYKRYTDIAKLSKFAGGIGVAWHRVRAKGSLITGTNGLSNGRRRQPGRPPQGRRLRLPRDVARRHRGLPRTA